MKLAVLGSSSLALETTLRFHAHGASVTWFQTTENQDTELGTSILGWQLLNKTPMILKDENEWVTNYAAPLSLILKESQMLRACEVVAVSKRFLTSQEEIKGKSRFHDLFRIIFQVNPLEFVENQKATDPQMYERLSQEMVESLQSTLEMYEDFDLVVDLRLPTAATSLNENGRALGETRVSEDKISSGERLLSDLDHLMTNGEIREMILVGSGEMALHAMIKLGDWVKNPVNRLFVVTTEELPFERVLKHTSLKNKKAFEAVMSEVHALWEKEMNLFHEKLREWQSLDDFVQAKKPRPTEPIPQVNFFSGHNVSGIDQLIDRKRLFVTLEKPDFRVGKWHPENNILDLKTLGVDHVLKATPLKRADILHFSETEKGYFSVKPEKFDTDLLKIKGIEDEIFKLFSPAHSS
jgi:hypothetical protein